MEQLYKIVSVNNAAVIRKPGKGFSLGEAWMRAFELNNSLENATWRVEPIEKKTEYRGEILIRS